MKQRPLSPDAVAVMRDRIAHLRKLAHVVSWLVGAQVASVVAAAVAGDGGFLTVVTYAAGVAAVAVLVLFTGRLADLRAAFRHVGQVVTRNDAQRADFAKAVDRGFDASLDLPLLARRWGPFVYGSMAAALMIVKGKLL